MIRLCDIDWESLPLHLSIPEIIDEIEARYGRRPLKTTVFAKLKAMGLDPQGRWSKPRAKKPKPRSDPAPTPTYDAEAAKLAEKKARRREVQRKYRASAKGKSTRAAYRARVKERARAVKRKWWREYSKKNREKLRVAWRRYSKKHAEARAARERARYHAMTEEQRQKILAKARERARRKRALEALRVTRKDSPCPASTLQRSRRVVSL